MSRTRRGWGLTRRARGGLKSWHGCDVPPGGPINNMSEHASVAVQADCCRCRRWPLLPPPPQGKSRPAAYSCSIAACRAGGGRSGVSWIPTPGCHRPCMMQTGGPTPLAISLKTQGTGNPFGRLGGGHIHGHSGCCAFRLLLLDITDRCPPLHSRLPLQCTALTAAAACACCRLQYAR